MGTTHDPAGKERPSAVKAVRARCTSTPPSRRTSSIFAVASASSWPVGMTYAKRSRRVAARRFTSRNVRSQYARLRAACSSTARVAASWSSTMSRRRQVPPGQGSGKFQLRTRGS